MHEPGQDAERELEQSVADPIAQNISEVLALESQEFARTTRAQRGFEAASRWLARPAYPIALLVFVVGWISLNLTARSVGLPHLDAPPFPWLNGILTLTALLTTTIVYQPVSSERNCRTARAPRSADQLVDGTEGHQADPPAGGAASRLAGCQNTSRPARFPAQEAGRPHAPGLGAEGAERGERRCG